jgi:hydroxymethylglutaryl-CoA reductase (NADPH)
MPTFGIRAILRSFSTRPARYPIETVVITFVIVTFAYFQCIHAIKHSDFLSGGISNPLHFLQPTVSRQAGDKWLTVPTNNWNISTSTKVDLVEILFSLDEPRKVVHGGKLSASINSPSSSSGITTSTPRISRAIQTVTEHITNSLTNSDGLSYTSVCYRPPLAADCLSWTHQTSRTVTLTLALLPSGRDQFVAAIESFRPTSWSAVSGFPQLEIIGKEESFLEMQSGKWVAYAARAFVIRFWQLAKV